MNLVLENPLAIVLIGGLPVLALTVGFFKTGRRLLALFAALLLALTVGAVCIERLVVTDREQVAATVKQIARDLTSNQPPQVIQHISQRAPELRQRAERLLPRAVIHEARVKRNLEIEVRPHRNPPLATARFNGLLVLSDKKGMVRNVRHPARFTVEFRKEGDVWRAYAYEEEPFVSPR